MQYKQTGRVRRVGDSEEYRVVIEVFLTPQERDLWGAGLATLRLVSAEPDKNIESP